MRGSLTFPKSTGNNIRLHDKWLFYIIYPAISILIVHIGNDNTFSELISIPSYYSDLLISAVCTFIVGVYLHYYHRRSASSFEHLSKSCLLNILIWGIVAPLFFCMSAEILYLVFMLHIPISNSSVFYLELPVALMFLVLINLIYLLLTLKTTKKQSENITIANHAFRTHFLVFSGSRALQIPANKVAYFIILEKSTFLVTHDNERFLYDYALEDIFNSINKSEFYQLNRQMIAHRNGIKSFTNTSTRRLKVELQPATEIEIYVSKIKAKEFANWLRASSGIPLSV